MTLTIARARRTEDGQTRSYHDQKLPGVLGPQASHTDHNSNGRRLLTVPPTEFACAHIRAHAAYNAQRGATLCGAVDYVYDPEINNINK